MRAPCIVQGVIVLRPIEPKGSSGRTARLKSGAVDFSEMVSAGRAEIFALPAFYFLTARISVELCRFHW